MSSLLCAIAYNIVGTNEINDFASPIFISDGFTTCQGPVAAIIVSLFTVLEYWQFNILGNVGKRGRAKKAVVSIGQNTTKARNLIM